jgi:hypothetical protein
MRPPETCSEHQPHSPSLARAREAAVLGTLFMYEKYTLENANFTNINEKSFRLMD